MCDSGSKTDNIRSRCLGLLSLTLLFIALESWAAEGPKGSVARALFTTDVINREPVDQVLIIGNDVANLYFFTDLRHLQGQTVTHRWEYQGKVVSSKSFDVKGPRWRVYSKADLQPHQTGRWTVVVMDERNWPLTAAIFEYRAQNDLPAEGAVIMPLE